MTITCTKAEVKAIRSFMLHLPHQEVESLMSRVKISVKGANPFQKLAYILDLKDEFKMEVSFEIEEEYFLAQMDLLEDVMGMLIVPAMASLKRLQAKTLALEEKFGMKPDDIEAVITDYDEEDRKHADEMRAKLQEAQAAAEMRTSQPIDVPDGNINNQ